MRALLFVSEIAQGMEYLHKMNITHSQLRTAACHVDNKWQVKVADWEVTSLFDNALLMSTAHEDADWSSSLFWTAPEVLRYRFESTKSSDAYSFAIVLQEIFIREHPYHELQGRCWEMDPMARPSFTNVVLSLKSASPSNRGVLHCLMDSMEALAVSLETKLTHKSRDLVAREKQLEVTLLSTNPPVVAEQLARGDKVMSEAIKSATVMCTKIFNFNDLIGETYTYDKGIDLLNYLVEMLDSFTERQQCFKVNELPYGISVISGLNENENDHVAAVCAVSLQWHGFLRQGKNT
ncbi:receptor-type guanylate cyclase gcy-2-like [Aplysia californica]|uniref:guanylate cyclase n=1 Tax=Aplysia californica TaxID=6500 RepID=A0ABM1AG49_APLCA|nr:receptor-type guanylate cyclase gcy-2-like [Aplysia californica]